MKFVKAITILALMAMAGCMVIGDLAGIGGLDPLDDLPLYKKRPAPFSHAAHIEFSIECVDCHPGARKSDRAGMPADENGAPSIAGCRECHEGLEVEADLEQFAPGGRVVWTDVTEISEEVIFSHRSHSENDVACDQCHPGIEKSKKVTRRLRNSKDDCMKCHDRYKLGSDCGLCHETVGRDWEPPTHRNNWERFHGQAARAGLEPPYANRCSLCHADSKCAGCHMDHEPRDHGSHWRHRGHGVAASMDRDRCATCHLSYSCDRCHRETAPRDHRGSWGAPRDRHCLACHFPLKAQRCYTCHKEMPGHLAAPEMPADFTHAAANNAGCKTCHGLPGPKHVDNGESCRHCHR